MSTVTVTIPKEYGYVLASTTASFLLAQWHGIWIGTWRKAAGVAYPRPYAFNTWSLEPASSDKSHPATGAVTDSEQAKNEYLFNCAQRAHGQLIEHIGIAVPAMLIAGLQYPLTSAASGAFWIVSRVIYAKGYTNPEKPRGSGRLTGSGYFLAEAVLMGLCGKMAFDMIMS